MILKFLRMIFVAFISLFNITLYTENEKTQENSIMNANTYAVNRIVINENEVANNTSINKKVSSISTTKTTNSNTTTNKTQTNKNNNTNSSVSTNNSKSTTNSASTTTANESSANKVLTSEKTDVPLAEYTGRLTGYGPDCVGCSGKGNVACKTREKKTFSLVEDGIYYTDSEYGKVRVLAAATSKFKCGTIVVVTKPGMESFTGIVLDTGGSMRKAWEQGNVWMDLAYSSNAMSGSDNLTGTNIKFSVQRWGW